MNVNIISGLKNVSHLSSSDGIAYHRSFHEIEVF